MTMNNAYPIAYMILAIVPFSFLQYYPFLNKIRVPKIVIGVMYSVLLLSELILFHNNNYVIIPNLLMLFYLLNILPNIFYLLIDFQSLFELN